MARSNQKPRSVRPVFVSVTCEDRASPIGTGPSSRSGKMRAEFTMRANGAVSPALDVKAGGTPGGTMALLEATTFLPSFAILPDGRTVSLPAGSVLRMSTNQDGPEGVEKARRAVRAVLDSVAGSVEKHAGDVLSRLTSPDMSDRSEGPSPRKPADLGPCACRKGLARDNCAQCEGTGRRIDFAAHRAAVRAALASVPATMGAAFPQSATCPECGTVPVADSKGIGAEGHVFVDGMFGIALACSADGRRGILAKKGA